MDIIYVYLGQMKKFEDECDATDEWVKDEIKKRTQSGPVKCSSAKKSVRFDLKRKTEAEVGMYDDTLYNFNMFTNPSSLPSHLYGILNTQSGWRKLSAHKTHVLMVLKRGLKSTILCVLKRE